MNDSSANPQTPPGSRRNFLRFVGGAALTGGLATLGWRMANSKEIQVKGPYGKLEPTLDRTTNLPLIKLPPGFRYKTFSWNKDPMDDGAPTPGAHDGMAVVRQDGDSLTLIRNHEISGRGKAFGKLETAYDPAAPGGCTVITFDTATERMTSSFVGIGGTIQNCAGGGTPWGTWLTCEENVGDKDTMNAADFEFVGYTREHGWVFEVSPTQPSTPRPYIEMGRFVHEAVAVDPVTGIVYLTEDSNPAGMYRYIPHTPGVLGNGGKLEMMVVEGKKDTRKGIVANESFKTRWVLIADPTMAHSPNSTDGKGVFKQGEKQGGASFARLEGIFFAEDRFVITATSGGDASQGQVWEYLPREERLRLLFASPGKDVLNMPDNLCITQRGCVMLCEDGGRQGQRLHALTPQGELFPFAENMVQLNGQKNGFRGDYRETEWSGVCFSPDYKWMFVNIQTPGMTFAITGPWEKGPI